MQFNDESISIGIIYHETGEKKTPLGVATGDPKNGELREFKNADESRRANHWNWHTPAVRFYQAQFGACVLM